jgi:hypothetical protein
MTRLPNTDTVTERYESFQDIIDSAAAGYVDLSYHNFEGHIKRTIEAVPGFCHWATANGIDDVPQEALATVMSHHDYEMHIPLLEKGTSTDEIHSAQILWRKLSQFTAGREIINIAVPAVIATTPSHKATSNFQLATRMLDVGNVCAEDFSTVLQNTLSVIVEEELELKNRKTYSFIEKRDKIASFLGNLYFPGTVEFVAVDGAIITYEPALIGFDNVRRLASISEREFVELVPEAEEKFAIIWPKAA